MVDEKNNGEARKCYIKVNKIRKKVSVRNKVARKKKIQQC